MAVIDYKKYKVSINPDSSKTQGLHIGDVVRRQYFTGKDVVYSLMCVLETGETEIELTDGQKQIQPWFVGALLEGDAPQTGEILDFVRVTSLFDTNRSGALYLTASDDQSPFMDVIDGIGRNCSLSWPERLAPDDIARQDAQSQYVVTDHPSKKEYFNSFEGHQRVCHLVQGVSKMGLKQDFTEYVADRERIKNNDFLYVDEQTNITELSAKEVIVISYWAKVVNPSASGDRMDVTLGYFDNARTDGTLSVTLSDKWEYKLHAITIKNSGRHKRAVTMDMKSLQQNQEIYIADFNIIRLGSLANFGDSSQIRVGKLTGIVDPVFGKLDGYGGYLQKLFASCSAHISGTLTAGDENGFGATFYAGKIHRNAFLNSLDIELTGATKIDPTTIINPTGIGNCYEVNGEVTMLAQDRGWMEGVLDRKGSKVNHWYCFSFWAYASTACWLTVMQDSKVVGEIEVDISQSRGWHRHHIAFKLQEPTNMAGELLLKISPTFKKPEGEDDEKAALYITAPQLESGQQVTQYQPTDNTLVYNEDYGAWFSMGGIGGTIQNPLIKLNADGDGAIASRTDTFRLRQDGSGHLAKGNIRWHANGDVEFGENVKLNWGNLSPDSQHQMENKSVRIEGADTFAVIGNAQTGALYSPDFVTLAIQETNIYPKVADREWSVLKNGVFIPITANQGLSNDKTTFMIMPDDTDLWEDMASSLTVKFKVTYQDHEYTDTVTIRKYSIEGYTVEVTSSKGETFRNGVCETILTAQVYYEGTPVPEEFVTKHFDYHWEVYALPDTENPLTPESGVDYSSKTFSVDTSLSGSLAYVCKIITKDGASFPYYFPILF